MLVGICLFQNILKYIINLLLSNKWKYHQPMEVAAVVTDNKELKYPHENIDSRRLLCCIIQKNRYKITTLAILKNGPNTNYSILVEGFKFS
jgi:hypothetical protein